MGFPLAPGLDTLPSLPSILHQLFQTLDDALSSARDIETIVERDPSTTGKLLAVANSSYYGLRHQITTLQRAVVVLGFDEVRNICLGAVLASMLNPRKFEDQKSAQELWRHSLGVQEAARVLATETGLLRPEVALIAALLHDLGWILILGYHPQKWEELKKLMEQESLTLAQAEKRLGLSHQEAGEALAKHWDLPPLMAQVMRRHHTPSTSLTYFPETALIHLADILASEAGMGFGNQASPSLPDPSILAGLGISLETFNLCRDKFGARLGELETFLRALLDFES